MTGDLTGWTFASSIRRFLTCVDFVRLCWFWWLFNDIIRIYKDLLSTEDTGFAEIKTHMCTKPLQIGFWNAWSTFQLLNPLVNHFCQQSRQTSESLSCCLSRTILSTLTSERIQWCKCLMSVLEYSMNSNTASSRAAYSTVQQNFSGEHKHTDIPHEKPETGNGPSGLRLCGGTYLNI